MITKVVYSIFIGILLATFVGVGIAAFYPEPKYPEYPRELRVADPFVKEATETAELRQQRIDFEDRQIKHTEAIKNYSKNVSVIVISFAIALLVLSLVILKNMPWIADGVLLGGVITLVYGVGRGFGSDDYKFRFVVVAIGLAVSLVLGHIKLRKV